jgi:mitogen-activated protein kinase kinase
MASAVRKKRNFKGLGLEVAAAPAPEPEPVMPVPTRLAPAAGKKRPPPMQLKAPKVSAAGTAVDAPPAPDADADAEPPPDSAAMASPATNTKRMTYHTALAHTLAGVNLNAEKKFELKNNDELRDIHELGQGNGGSVKKVEHVPTGTIMAKKVCYLRINSSGRATDW